MNRLYCILLIILTFLLAGSFVPNQQPLFFISKGENKNQVHYAIQLDNQCFPISSTPIYAYWLMLEKGSNVTEPLLPREQRAYGFAIKNIHLNKISFTLNALPNKNLSVVSTLKDGKCNVEATTDITGENAILESVYVDLWIFGVKSITIYGHKVKDGSKVQEVIK